MQTFRFNAIDRQGRVQTGQLGATDERELETVLRGRGVWLLDARTENPRRPFRLRLFQRTSRRDLIQFCTLMAFQTRVGVPLVQALDAASQEGVSLSFGAGVTAVRGRIETGSSLAGAMAEAPKVFPRDLVQLLRAGEQGGSLPEAFTQAKHHLEWQERITAEVTQATLYPALVLAATVLFVLVLFTFVVPKFVTLLAAVKVPLPAPTRAVFAVSSLAKEFSGIFCVGGGVLIGLCAWLRHRFPAVARWLDQGRLGLPVLGPLVRMVVMTRFTHNLALLYRNGVSLPAALDLVSGVVGSPLVAGAVRDIRRGVLTGSSLSEAMRRHPVFPPLLVRLVVVGERTGQLDEALEQVASHYHELLPRHLKRLLGLLEPGLILGLVVVVGVVALAVILPVLSLMQNLR